MHAMLEGRTEQRFRVGNRTRGPTGGQIDQCGMRAGHLIRLGSRRE
jgi:hypothetical protein